MSKKEKNRQAALEWSQRMAEGGNPILALEDLAQPQSVPPPTIAAPPLEIPAPAEPAARVWPSERERLAGITDAERAARGDLPVGAGGSPAEIERNRLYTPWAQTGEGPRPPPASPEVAPAGQGEHPWTLPAAQASIERAQAVQAAPGGAQPQSGQGAATVARQGGLEGAFERGAETPGERAQRETEQAVEKKGQIQKTNLEQQQSELQRQEAERQQAQRDFLAAQKENERLHQEWAAKVPDQNRWWAAKSTGNKIGSAIAMIVGGFASGVSGQKNQALAVIEDSIARDVQSQADQKNSMVSFYVGRGRSLQEAYQLTASNLMLSAANRMEQLKASMGAQMVGPDTELAIKGLRAQAAQLQQAAGLKALEARKMMAEIGKIGAETAKAYAEAGKAAKESQGIRYGKAITSDQLSMVSPGAQTKFAHIGNGMWMPAASEEQAKLSTAQFESARNMSRSIGVLEGYMKKGTLVKGSEDYAAAQAAANAMMGPMRTLLGLGVLSESDKDLVNTLVAHPEEMFTLGSTSRGRIKELRRMANQAFANGYERLGVTIPETEAR